MIESQPIHTTAMLKRGASDDLDAVMQVMAAAFDPCFGEAWTRSQCAGILPMTGVALTLARDATTARPLGFSLFRTIADESELLLIAVEPNSRGRGVGRQLLEEFMQRAKSAGAVRLHLEVRDGNPAVAIYQKAGFAPVRRRRNYYRGSDHSQFDALTFARDI